MPSTTKVFKNGGSKAVRLPSDSCEVGDEMLVRKIGYAIMLIPKDKAWKMFDEAVGQADPDFMPTRDQGQDQKRKRL